MRTLVLNGFRKGDSRWQEVAAILSEELINRGWPFEEIRLCEMDIADCAGCFSCWTRTPGICFVDDAGREIARRFAGCDLVVLFSPVTFGGYSSELKKALDRLIPLISPFFKSIQGEVHHRRRYDRYPALIGIGMTEDDGEEKNQIFRKLLRRNVINLHNPKNAVGIIVEREDPVRIREKVRDWLQEVAR
jgi:multimeric flavodoxin WrbA